MALKCMILISTVTILGTFSALGNSPERASVVELGASQVQGTRPEPGEMIIVSRASVDLSIQAARFNGKARIKEDVETSRLFDVSYGK